VTIPIQDTSAQAPRFVRIQAVSSHILRVTATREDTFAVDRSLITMPVGERPNLYLLDDGQDYIVYYYTPDKELHSAQVNKRSGAITFAHHTVFDERAGEVIPVCRMEAPVFAPYVTDGKEEWSIAQTLSTGDEECHFYGLGQHQSDEWDYGDKEEELYQYNTKVSIPMMLSTSHFALLWDSYSYGRWGHATPYAPLNVDFDLKSSYGTAGALTGRYVADDGSVLVRAEADLCYDDIFSIRNLPTNIALQKAQVTYDGWLLPHHNGIEQFSLYYAGYMQVYMNDSLVVPERWRAAWNPNTYKFSLPVDSLRPIHLRIEWRPDGGISYCALRGKYLPPADRAVGCEQRAHTFWQEMSPELDYYYIEGAKSDSLIAGYRTLTGRAPIMPRWALGYWQSRERYKTQAELLETLREFRRRNFPIDNIVQDWSYWEEDAWGSHEFDTQRFPDPKGMVDSIHALHGRFMISVWPKFYASTEHFQEFDRQGWIYRRAIEDSIRDWIGPGYLGSFYDAYSAGARQLFWQQMYEHLYPLGVDAWWMDASEPNVRDCTPLAYRKALCGPTALGPSDEYFNAYALMNAQAIYEGQRSVDPDRRVFLLTRSGFAGQQRYSTATWSGDIAARWEDLQAQITAGLNFSVSGVPYWSMDIGGFSVENRFVQAQKEFDRTGFESADLREWRELYTRWFQFGAWVPLFRSHGQYPWREPWNVAPEWSPTYKALLAAAQMRYALMPYLYSLSARVHEDHYTLMRPLFMDFDGGNAADNRSIEAVHDQYMFGPSVMVCPVYRYGARTREVKFPQGHTWYDLRTGAVAADTHGVDSVLPQTVAAPYDYIPLFVPDGSILPTGAAVQYSDERPMEELTLYIYAGSDGTFTLYDDDGVTYAYEQGACCHIPLVYDDTERTLTIGEREGSYPTMPTEITFHLRYITPQQPIPFGDQRPTSTVRYTGTPLTVQLTE
jgi:alpha-D-xyloside xylohydrolase